MVWKILILVQFIFCYNDVDLELLCGICLLFLMKCHLILLNLQLLEEINMGGLGTDDDGMLIQN